MNGTDVESAPPGFKTLTKTVPAFVMSEAGTRALNCPPDSEVARAVVVAPAFHWITEPETKFEPMTANWNAGPPAVAEEGTSGGVIEGVIPGAMVKATELELTVPGFCTRMRAVPGLASKVAGMVAVTSVVLTNPVARLVALPLLFQTTIDPL